MTSEVTYEQVWEAAKALEVKQEPVAVATVRNELGHVGDFATINEALEMWHNGYGQ